MTINEYDADGKLVRTLSYGEAAPCKDGDADGTVSVIVKRSKSTIAF